MWKAILIGLGTLALMLVCGAVTLFAIMLLLMNLGTAWHENYEYYGKYPWLALGPALVAFLLPAFVVGYAMRRADRRD